MHLIILNPFHAASHFLYPWNISENLWYRVRPVSWNVLNVKFKILFSKKITSWTFTNGQFSESVFSRALYVVWAAQGQKLPAPLHKNWSFPLRIFSVNMTKSAKNLWIWSHLLNKSLMENFIFCAVQKTLFRGIYFRDLRP